MLTPRADFVSMTDSALSCGVDQLDQVLNGLLPGDNVVWITEPDAVYELFEEKFLAAAAASGHVCASVIVDGTPATARGRLPEGATIIDMGSFSLMTPDQLRQSAAVLRQARPA